MNRSSWWFLPLALVWPVAHSVVFALRFGRFSAEQVLESAVFLPMGILSALVVVLLLGSARNGPQRAGTWAGYLVAAPIAFIGSLGGGLVFPPVIGALVFGALPLIAGAWIGFSVGSRVGARMRNDPA